jgi:hypothetical protein
MSIFNSQTYNESILAPMADLDENPIQDTSTAIDVDLSDETQDFRFLSSLSM